MPTGLVSFRNDLGLGVHYCTAVNAFRLKGSTPQHMWADTGSLLGFLQATGALSSQAWFAHVTGIL